MIFFGRSRATAAWQMITIAVIILMLPYLCWQAGDGVGWRVVSAAFGVLDVWIILAVILAVVDARRRRRRR